MSHDECARSAFEPCALGATATSLMVGPPRPRDGSSCTAAADIELTHAQSAVVDAVFAPHHKGDWLCVCGGCGTGKSAVIQVLQAVAVTRGLLPVVVAPTARVAITHAGRTLNSAFGFLPRDRISGNLVKAVRRTYWRHRDGDHFLRRPLNSVLLIVDEAFMVSAQTLELLDEAVRALPHASKLQPMGGMRVVLVGDPGQLPPISDDRHGDPGHFLFESKLFTKCVRHTFFLAHRIRSHDPQLTWLLRAIEDGSVARDDAALARAHQLLCTRWGVPPPPDALVMASTKARVAMHNSSLLARLAMGAKDSSEEVQIGPLPHAKGFLNADTHGILHPKLNDALRELEDAVHPQLFVQRGAPCSIIFNISTDVINGMRGIITSVEPPVDLRFARLWTSAVIADAGEDRAAAAAAAAAYNSAAGPVLLAEATDAYHASNGGVVFHSSVSPRVTVRVRHPVSDEALDVVMPMAIFCKPLPADAFSGSDNSVGAGGGSGAIADIDSPTWPCGFITTMPLIVGSASTYHRNQGMTVSGSVVIDTAQLFERGMLSMSIARVRRLSSLHFVSSGGRCDGVPSLPRLREMLALNPRAVAWYDTLRAASPPRFKRRCLDEFGSFSVEVRRARPSKRSFACAPPIPSCSGAPASVNDGCASIERQQGMHPLFKCQKLCDEGPQ